MQKLRNHQKHVKPIIEALEAILSKVIFKMRLINFRKIELCKHKPISKIMNQK